MGKHSRFFSGGIWLGHDACPGVFCVYVRDHRKRACGKKTNLQNCFVCTYFSVSRRGSLCYQRCKIQRRHELFCLSGQPVGRGFKHRYILYRKLRTDWRNIRLSVGRALRKSSCVGFELVIYGSIIFYSCQFVGKGYRFCCGKAYGKSQRSRRTSGHGSKSQKKCSQAGARPQRGLQGFLQ